MGDDKNAPLFAVSEDWWKEEILPQIEEWIEPNPPADPLSIGAMFPSNKMKDYVRKDVPFADTWIEREIAATIQELKSTYDKLAENAPVPIWCDDNKTVLTVRQLFVEAIFNALDTLHDLKPSKILERGYV